MKTKLDKSNPMYKKGYEEAVNNTYHPPVEEHEWFLYHSGRDVGLKEQRLQRLIQCKRPFVNWVK